jgi:uncharacterized BrkB/YihY/UPF0761 family membrane protein
LLSGILLAVFVAVVRYMVHHPYFLTGETRHYTLLGCSWALTFSLMYFTISFLYWVVPAKWWRMFR